MISTIPQVYKPLVTAYTRAGDPSEGLVLDHCSQKSHPRCSLLQTANWLHADRSLFFSYFFFQWKSSS